MKGWKQCQLGDIIEFGNGKVRPKNMGDIPVYGGNGILGYGNESNYFDETIVIGRVGAYCGAVYYENKPIWVSDNALSAKPTNNQHAKFLFYYLKNLSLNQFAEGSSHPLVTQTLLRSIDVEIPTYIPEQRAIAGVLSSLDDKIDLLHRQNKTLEAMAEALFRQWFVEEADAGWEEGKLGDLIHLEYGKALKDEARSGSGFPVVGSSGIVGYHDDFLVKGPGIVIGRKGTLGKVHYFPSNFFPIDTTYYVQSKRPSERLIFELFLLKTISFENMNSDSAVPGLNRDIALSFELKIPPLKLVKQFSDSVSGVLNKYLANIEQIRSLESLRDTLLPKLMSGEVRVIF